jgi:DNA polymerase (family 10)
MENPEVAQVFEEVADMLDIQGENPFRVRAYRNAARTVRDLAQPLAEMAGNGCLLELNSQPDRLDLDDTALMAAKKRGVGIVVSTDAHSVEELGLMEFGVYQARRAGLEARDVANTRTLAQFRKLLKR